jgi:hypothetical protein
MTDHPSAVPAVSAVRRQISSIALFACIASLSIVGAATAQAKQSCSVAAGSQGYWSWRMIDERKCWYLGKPMLSKTELEWPKQAQQTAPVSRRELASEPATTHGDPMNAQAYAPDKSTTFDAMWRDRIEKR